MNRTVIAATFGACLAFAALEVSRAGAEGEGGRVEEPGDPGATAGLGTPLGREVFASTWVVYADAQWTAAEWDFQWSSSGTAVGYRRDGWLITNEHVTRGARTLTVTGPDGVAREADRWLADPFTDVALIHVPDVEVHVPRRGRRNGLSLGEQVLVFGHPRGFPRTLTAGVVSGLHRAYFPNGARNTPVMDFIQTDASSHPGNSGGGLFLADGTLVGIYKAGTSSVDGRSGIGFAIAVDDAQFVADRLLDAGAIRHGWVEVGLHNCLEIPLQVRQEYGITRSRGVVVTTRYEEGGQVLLEPGDWIQELDGEVLVNWTQFEMLISRHEPGAKVKLELTRRGERRSVHLTLGELR